MTICPNCSAASLEYVERFSQQVAVTDTDGNTVWLALSIIRYSCAICGYYKYVVIESEQLEG